MNLFRYIFSGGLFGSLGFGDHKGQQQVLPSTTLVRGSKPISPDGAMQLSAVWACVNTLADTISSLPLHVYQRLPDGQKKEARESRLWHVLQRPNAHMTAHDFWKTMAMNRYLRGNGYAKISRDGDGELVALTPLSADQMTVFVDDSGGIVYQYMVNGNIQAFAPENILHWRGVGNGIIGISTLDYMRATVTELANAQCNATSMYGNGNQLTGLLLIDQDLNKTQIQKLKERFAGIGSIQGSSDDWLKVLPGDMKYQQISMSPADTQLLESRQFGIDEIGRWFGVPSAMINGSGGASVSSIELTVEQFYRSTIVPECVAIEQLISTALLKPEERDMFCAEFKLSGLMRSSVTARADFYSRALQNGWMSRNEVRKLENLEPVAGADDLTAQNNLVPLHMLGAVDSSQSDQTPLDEPTLQ